MTLEEKGNATSEPRELHKTTHEVSDFPRLNFSSAYFREKYIKTILAMPDVNTVMIKKRKSILVSTFMNF